MTKKVIWITGASSGIGKALAIKFAKENWNVAISARRENILKEISESHENINFYTLDVTDGAKCIEVFNKIKKDYSNVDLCVFSSGIYEPKNEKEINLDHMNEVMKVNYFGTVNCIKSVENYFKEKRSGHISIISSVAGYRGLPNSSGYGPSKAALIHLAESLYFDFSRSNVRVSLISPGFIKTRLTDKNTFKMPFLRSAEFAADKIYKGLVENNSFEITFPKQLTVIMKIFKVMPNSWYLYLIKKLTKLQKR